MNLNFHYKQSCDRDKRERKTTFFIKIHERITKGIYEAALFVDPFRQTQRRLSWLPGVPWLFLPILKGKKKKPAEKRRYVLQEELSAASRRAARAFGMIASGECNRSRKIQRGESTNIRGRSRARGDENAGLLPRGNSCWPANMIQSTFWL